MADEGVYGRERYRAIALPQGAKAEVWFLRLGNRIEMHTEVSSVRGGGRGRSTSNWTACSQIGCIGEAILNGGTCFAHSSPEVRQVYLSQIPDLATKAIFSLRGNKISAALWNEIVPWLFDGNILRAPVSLVGSEITTSIRLRGADFRFSFELSCADVFEHIELRQCEFHSNLTARHALFNGGALNCHESKFHQDVDVSYSHVERVSLGFERCTFERGLTADGLDGPIYLNGSTVRGNASFKESKGHLIANGCELHGALDLSGAECTALTAEGLVAHAVTRVGPCSIPFVNLPRAIFGSRVHIELTADTLNLARAMLKEGGLLVVDKAKLQLEQLSLGGPLRVSGGADTQNQPEILSLLNADAGQISFANVNLTRCSFRGAHGLGTIEIEATTTFPRAPWWAGRRRFIADEYAWRYGAGKLHNFGWSINEVHVGAVLPKPVKGGGPSPILLQPLGALQVASVYRDLRRSLEAKSDMPGAADFYYGEMEMRRWDKGRSAIERFLVSCYWLTCGYGLRPGRALLVWFALVAMGAFTFCQVGLAPEQALLTAVRASVPGVPTVVALGANGQAIETVLRVLGAIVAALFLISARSLVMRKPGE